MNSLLKIQPALRLSLSLIVFAWISRFVIAAEPDGAVGQMLREGDWAKIQGLADQLEQNYFKNPSKAYFFKMAEICKGIGEAKELKSNEFFHLQDFAERVLTKTFVFGDSASTEAWRAKCDIVHILVQERPLLKDLDESAFATIRARNANLASIFYKQVLVAYNKDFKPKSVALNIAPPLNLDGESLVAGMDPAQIKNLESRKAYEDAIRANAKCAEENSVQALLRGFYKNDLREIVTAIEQLYKRDPKAPSEIQSLFPKENK